MCNMLKRKSISAFFLLCVSIGILIFFLFSEKDRERLSEYPYSPQILPEIVSTAAATSDPLVISLRFNGYELFLDEESSTFYYSLIERDPDAYDPYVRMKCRSSRVKIYIIDGELTPESVRSNQALRFIASDGKYFREYRIRYTTLPIMNIDSDVTTIEGKGKDREMVMTLFDNRADVRQ